jgi:predicted nucleic acid-binding protein
VLIELRSVLTRKLKPAPSWQDTRVALEALARFEVAPANTSLILDAHELSRTKQLAWFDTLIVEAAIRSGCERLYSEGLDHGRVFGALRVSNPFVSDEAGF